MTLKCRSLWTDNVCDHRCRHDAGHEGMCSCRFCGATEWVVGRYGKQGPTEAKPSGVSSMAGYHLRDIPKGTFGTSSKILEEVYELIDAEEQGVVIMAARELSDIYGALRAVARKHGLRMSDLAQMSKATRRAFKEGHRS